MAGLPSSRIHPIDHALSLSDDALAAAGIGPGTMRRLSVWRSLTTDYDLSAPLKPLESHPWSHHHVPETFTAHALLLHRRQSV